MSINSTNIGPSVPKGRLANRLRLALLTGGAACAIAPLAAHAAEVTASAAPQAQEMKELVVTAQRREESIQSVALPMTVVTSDTIASANVRDIKDYFAMTPNVSFVTNGSRDRKELSIRGVSNQLDPYSDVRPASFAFYIDEFSVSAGTSNPDVLDLERIEILRGPQGTYFGRNSIGGAINVTTKKPNDDLSGQINLGYASFDTLRASAIANIPLVKDLFAVRIALQQEKSDGNIKNINPIGGGNNTKYQTGRIIARFTPTSEFTWDNTFSITKERNGMRDGVPTGFLTRTWRQLHYANQPGNIADPDGVGFYPENRNRVNYNTPQSVGTDFWYANSRAVYEFDSFSVTAVGGYLKSSIFNKGDVDGGSLDLYNEDNNTERRSLSGELRLQSLGKSRFEWSIGVAAGRDTGAIDQSTFYGTQNKQGGTPGVRITGLDTHAVNKYQAVFGQGTYHLTDQFNVTLGGRYSWEQVTRSILRSSNEVILDNVQNRHKSFSNFSPKVTLEYKPADNTLLYATYSKGFKSGGVQSAQASLKTSYAPETIANYEAGFKTDFFDRRLTLDVAAFYLQWKNVQQAVRFQVLVPQPNGTSILQNINGIDNAASAHSYGIDGSAHFRVNEYWDLGFHAGYLKAKYDEYQNALIDGVLIDASGKPMIASPKWTLGGNIEYRHPLFSDYEGFIRGEWNYRSKILSSFYALRYTTFPFVAPGYHNVNLRVGVENEKYSATVFVENLFDANYYNNAYEKAFYSGVQVDPSFRRVGINLSAKF